MSLLARNTVKAATGTLHAATRRSMATAPLLVSPKEVQGASDTPRVFLDASWHMPNSPRKAREEFVARRIPGARFLDLDEVASAHELGLKHMMPSGDVFARACGE
jgi:thiosulfate/3-mercaptopyruvate sulfurtransferase